ncbi:GAF and ANTAR domain-containing protein [Herbiconiux liukaitaii]|uniref:GAF and ANTAR domain-containing protein n=1 Tax=Herbiconiux liukaitaii TaxID=3342799 RepID=UPI0035B6B92F
MSTLGVPFDIETVSASDDVAARISELQIDAGEGPCWDAHRTRAPVLIPDLGDVAPARWPVFTHTIADLDVHAIYSFPLAIGNLQIGVVDLYAEGTDTLTPDAVADAGALADQVAADVLRHALARRGDDSSADGPFSRREVHQATGMVLAQLHLAPADALLLIRAHAYASGRSVRETAADITARRLTLRP